MKRAYSTEQPFSRLESGETRLDSALDNYLLTKSKANETGNYRRNGERVLDKFLDWAEQRDVETVDALDESTRSKAIDSACEFTNPNTTST